MKRYIWFVSFTHLPFREMNNKTIHVTNLEGHISMLCVAIQYINPPNTDQNKRRLRKKKDLDVAIPDITWGVFIDCIHSSSTCICHCYSLNWITVSFSPDKHWLKCIPLMPASLDVLHPSLQLFLDLSICSCTSVTKQKHPHLFVRLILWM